MKGLTFWQRLQYWAVRRINRLYRERIQPRVFEMSKADVEVAHEWALARLEWVSESFLLRFLVSLIGVVRDKRLAQFVCGLRWRSPLGLAAGYDKRGEVFPALASLGFCGIELGGFTRHEQPGKPRPRMFRLPKYRALINWMGFNNPGAVKGAKNIRAVQRGKFPVPLGINLGKSLVTPIEEAAGDYVYSIVELYSCGDYFVVNVSSPNTPQLRLLQNKEYLRALIREVKQAADRSRPPGARRKPILVKVSPDLSNEQLNDVIEVCIEEEVDGIIAVNTTINRTGVDTDLKEGGLSGPPLRARALEVVRYIRERVPDSFIIIGVGGISSARDAWNMLKAGADLIQLYTALVYEGPFVAAEINLGLLRLMYRDGVTHISQLRQRR